MTEPAASDEPTLRNEDESWTVIGDDPHNLHVVQAVNHDLRVCFLTSNGPTERRGRLIAAAPDLLAALETVRRIIGNNDMTFDQLARARMLVDDIARSAITKATVGSASSDNSPGV